MEANDPQPRLPQPTSCPPSGCRPHPAHQQHQWRRWRQKSLMTPMMLRIMVWRAPAQLLTDEVGRKHQLAAAAVAGVARAIQKNWQPAAGLPGPRARLLPTVVASRAVMATMAVLLTTQLLTRSTMKLRSRSPGCRHEGPIAMSKALAAAQNPFVGESATTAVVAEAADRPYCRGRAKGS